MMALKPNPKSELLYVPPPASPWRYILLMGLVVCALLYKNDAHKRIPIVNRSPNFFNDRFIINVLSLTNKSTLVFRVASIDLTRGVIDSDYSYGVSQERKFPGRKDNCAVDLNYS